MGSFIVTVVGANPEQQMLKYSSVNSIERPNPYIQLFDATDTLHEKIPLDFDGCIPTFLSDMYCLHELKTGEVPDFNEKHVYGYYTLGTDGKIEKLFERKNPLEECDGFVLGGGWAGFYFIKPGHTGVQIGTPRRGTVIRPNTADMAEKGSIDFERMMREAGDKAAQQYDAFYALAAKHNNYIDEAFEEEFFKGTQDGTFPMYASTYDYNHERSHFIKLREYYEISSYAFIIDGEINKKPHSIGPLPLDAEIAWLESFWNKLFSLPDDTLFSLYQCHE
jgi:hypothetical protein